MGGREAEVCMARLPGIIQGALTCAQASFAFPAAARVAPPAWEGCALEHSGAGGWAGWNWSAKVKSWQGEVVQGEVTRQARSSSP